MTKFVNDTVDDMRCGRQNWRVLLFFCSAAFFITVALTAAAMPH